MTSKGKVGPGERKAARQERKEERTIALMDML